jgi:hypothetical protein
MLELKAMVDASPSGIAVIVARDKAGNPSWYKGASKLDPFKDGSPSWDHAAVAWKQDGVYWFGELQVGTDGLGPLGSTSKPGAAHELMSNYKHVSILPIDLSMCPPGARDRFIEAVTKALKTGATYSFLKGVGNVCSGAIGKGFAAAEADPTKPPPANLPTPLPHMTRPPIPLGPVINTDFTPKQVSQVAGPDGKYHYNVPDDQKFGPKWVAPFGDYKQPSFQTAFEILGTAALAETALAHAQQAAKGDDQKPEEEPPVALTSDTEDTPSDDAAQQAATDDKEEASQEQVALALDTEDAPSDDAAVMETVSTQAVADPPSDDQTTATGQPATSIVINPDELDASRERITFKVQLYPDGSPSDPGMPRSHPRWGDTFDPDTDSPGAGANLTVDDQTAATGQPATSTVVNPDELDARERVTFKLQLSPDGSPSDPGMPSSHPRWGDTFDPTEHAASPKPGTDGNQGTSPSQEQVATTSDNKNAFTNDAAVMQTTSAQAVADPTDDQAGATGQAPTSVFPAAIPAVIPDNPDTGFSYAAFLKPGVTVEAGKEAMPVEQPSPEGNSSSGTPVSESAHPDIGSEDVGNAAPTKEPVVHHGDLAP